MAESNVDLAWRAAKHGALSDPARLSIVDALSLGDLSPGDLSVMLAMPSNLVAHHLRVLESVGILERSRSEADRRRTYLKLAPEAMAGVMPGATIAATRVVFVCTANSARSQLAAALWRRASPIPGASAGTHPAASVDPGAVAVARRHDLTIPDRKPRPLQGVVDRDDFVVTVCDSAREELRLVDSIHWSVPDPVRLGTSTAFESAFTDLDRRVAELAPRLTKESA